MNSFYSDEELKDVGFNMVGTNVLVSKKCSIFGPQNMNIGNNVRIDDFCILSGKIELGNNIHIAAYSALYGGNDGIKIDDFANLSSRVSVYSVSDDYSGETMTNPTIPEKYKNVQSAPIYIGRHAIIGSNAVILPGVIIAEGS
ncbi:MAG: acyltransferase [Huintestinicola sp.]